MTPGNRDMLVFVTKWARFGRGDEYILPEFGVSPSEFYQRVLVMVTTPLTAEMDFATKQFLRQFCLSKISGFRARNSNVPKGIRTQRAESEATNILSTSATFLNP